MAKLPPTVTNVSNRCYYEAYGCDNKATVCVLQDNGLPPKHGHLENSCCKDALHYTPKCKHVLL
uniref:SWIM-type domain-containing protein n=1 Tax=Globodera pallida TaxID=36090 RepID=A0A183CRW5_GLOPA